MGLALAEEAASRGWATTLLLGPTQLMPGSSPHLRVIRFQTAAELNELLIRHWPQHDLLIMAAAVADFRPARDENETGTMRSKRRRTKEPIILKLEPTPDLLASLADRTRSDQTVIGFALEPAAELLVSAGEKLARKKLDAIVANPLETMDASDITAALLLKDGKRLDAPPGLSKSDFARWLLDRVRALHDAET